MFRSRNSYVGIISFLFALALFLSLSNLTPSIERTRWNTTYPTEAWSYPYSVQQTQDGGYIIIGRTSTTSSDQTFLIKTNSTGGKEWVRSFPGQGFTVRATQDGGYILGGSYNGPFIIKTNSTGDTEWSIKDADGMANSIIETGDGGFIVSEPKDGSIYLIKLNSAGDVQWNKKLGGSPMWLYGMDTGDKDLQRTPDGGYIIVGGTVLDENGVSVGPNGIVVLVKTDYKGNEIWNNTLGKNIVHAANSVQVTTDGGYFLIALAIQPPETGYVFKTDPFGNMMWNRTYGDAFICDSILAVPNGNLVVVGHNSTQSGLIGVVIEIDSSGNLFRVERLGDYLILCSSVSGTDDGGYIVAGTTSDGKVFLVKR
jgi:hypothetical protein